MGQEQTNCGHTGNYERNARLPIRYKTCLMFAYIIALVVQSAIRLRLQLYVGRTSGSVSTNTVMFDVVVVGLGGVGSFCLRALSKRGLKVAGIERFRRLHDRGSSHGGSRIYRKAYFEGSMYVPWIQYSEQVFRELDETLVENCGTLIIEEPGGPLINACSRSAELFDIATEHLTNAELQHHYPQFRLVSDDTVGLLEPGGGFIRPENAMKVALNDAESNGAKIFEEVIVDQLKEVDNYVELHTIQNKSPGMMQAKSVVVASGSWTSDLVSSWSGYLQATRQLQAWIDVGDSAAYMPSNFPTWCMSTPNHPLTLYGVPKDPRSDTPTWIQLGLHGRDISVNPCHRSPHLVSIERRELLDAARLSLTCEPDFALAKPCLYTMSRDGHFILGRPSEFNRVAAAAGLSGHGFKMAPALGQILADLILDEDFDKWNAGPLSPTRFDI